MMSDEACGRFRPSCGHGEWRLGAGVESVRRAEGSRFGGRELVSVKARGGVTVRGRELVSVKARGGVTVRG
ncbi:hypothetical protein GCM10009744_01740 [Kribbella alba]|uniref:Uncharacterized protein n=1 Tax=Kribbella alba TaxID=190197 RepID=A0ABN2EVC0_9ACTN